MNTTKTLAIMALIAALVVGVWALKDKAEADAARADGWEYVHMMQYYFAKAEPLEASAAQKGWIFVGLMAVAAILWGLGEVAGRLPSAPKAAPDSQPDDGDWRARSLENK